MGRPGSVRKTYEEQVEEPLRQAYAKIANARFALYGTGIYPTPPSRCGWPSAWSRATPSRARQIPPWTTIGGAYQRAQEHDNKAPFDLPPSWLERKGRLNLQTPFNFVSTADIIGGNSGSPVVNRHGELVGIIFDGNLPSLVWDYVYTDKVGRSIAVHSGSIPEALRKVYGAGALADELGR